VPQKTTSSGWKNVGPVQAAIVSGSGFVGGLTLLFVLAGDAAKWHVSDTAAKSLLTVSGAVGFVCVCAASWHLLRQQAASQRRRPRGRRPVRQATFMGSLAIGLLLLATHGAVALTIAGLLCGATVAACAIALVRTLKA